MAADLEKVPGPCADLNPKEAGPSLVPPSSPLYFLWYSLTHIPFMNTNSSCVSVCLPTFSFFSLLFFFFSWQDLMRPMLALNWLCGWEYSWIYDPPFSSSPLLGLLIGFYKHLFYYLFVSAHVCECACVCALIHVCAGASGRLERVLGSWNYSYRQLWAARCGYQKPNLGTVQEHPALWAAEPSLQSGSHQFYVVMGTEPRASCVLGSRSASWSASP